MLTQEEWKNLQWRIQLIESRINALEDMFQVVVGQFKEMVKADKEVIKETKQSMTIELTKLVDSLEKTISEEINQKLNEQHPTNIRTGRN